MASMTSAAAARKGKSRKPRKAAADEPLGARVTALASEIKAMKELVIKTYDLLQRVEKDLVPASLADVDPDDASQLARFEGQSLVRARTHLAVEMRALRELGIIDRAGHLIEDQELPDDMREGSACDL